jgi:NitT/TauT family transport system substrate-binding protein
VLRLEQRYPRYLPGNAIELLPPADPPDVVQADAGFEPQDNKVIEQIRPFGDHFFPVVDRSRVRDPAASSTTFLAILRGPARKRRAVRENVSIPAIAQGCRNAGLPLLAGGQQLGCGARRFSKATSFRPNRLALTCGMVFANRNQDLPGVCAAAPRHAEQQEIAMAVSKFVTGAVAGLTVALVATAAAAQQPVKFTLDWKFEGPAAPFVVAIDKGYFKAEGLDVAIDTAGGSLEPLNRIASGTYDIGFGDINSLIKFRDANPNVPIKAVFMVYNKPPFSIVGRKSRGVVKPKDLEGKKLGAPAPDGAYAQWPIFVKANGIDASKVTIENVGFPVREPMLAAGQVDAITGFSFSSYINLKDRGVPADDITVLLMADYGVNLYGNAIIVNPKFAAEKPEAVKAFLRAFTKGMQEAVRSPATAVDSVLKRNDVAKKEVELERLKMAIRDNILTDEVKKNGFGGVDLARLDGAIDQIALTFAFKAKPKAADIFDASFLPDAAARQAN